MTVDIATLAIRIDSQEARAAVRDLENFQGSGARAERSISGLETAARKAEAALAFLGIGAGVSAIIKYADEYTKFTAQLNLATQSQREYSAAVDDVRRIATSAQQDLSATGMLYARISNGTRELGISQKNVADITETVNLALKVSGATSAEAASAMLQLSQSFASGTLRGEEFNAVNEAAPRLMQALADGLGVPIGALKEMASNGEITSRVMATVLPQALNPLKDESKHVQTISGAFTVLKNNVMEFTGTQAQANGTVSILTGGIVLLAKNLDVLMGVIGTIAAAKFASKFDEWATGAYRSVTANRALVAANLVTANSNVAATAAALATATAREAELRASVLAADGAVALAIAENGLIPQQARAAAAAEAHTAALSAQAAAQRAASVGAGVLNGTISLLGGPIGAIVTLLGLAATAWSVWGKKSEEGSKHAAESFEQAHARIVKGLDEQIAKNEKLIRLQKLGMPQDKAEKDMPVLEQLGKYSAMLNDINNRTGEYAPDKGKSDTDVLMDRLKILKYISEETEKLQKRNATADEAAQYGPAAQAMVAIRERLTGVTSQYTDTVKALKTAYDAKAIGEKEYISTLSQLAIETWKGSEAGKAATSAAQKSAEAYKALISSALEATATNKLELAAGVNASDAQKARIKLDQELLSGKIKLEPKQQAAIRAALDEQEATEKLVKTQQLERDVLGFIVQSTQARLASKDALAVEYAEYGKGSDARELAMIAVRNEAEVERFLADQRKAGKSVTDEMIGQLKLEASERTKVEKATLSQTKALGYASQLEEQNKRFAADAITDEKARAAALSEIDADIWRKRIALAGEGTEAQKILQEQYSVWYQNQALKPIIDSQRDAMKKYDDIFRQGFADMLNNGKSGWQSFTKSLTTTFKTTVADQIYKMLAQPFVVSLIGNMVGLSGGGAAGAVVSGAAGAASSALTGASIGATLGAIGSGAFQTAGAVLSGQIGLFDTIGAGFSALSTGTMSGLTAGLSSLAGTLGPIALGVAGIMALVNKWDTSGTIHTGGAASASAAGVSNISAGTLGFQPINTADATNKLTSQLASSVVSMLDSTATAFGKTAGYTAATAFADDTSKDGAWGALIISNMNGLVSQWGDANSRWAPKVFSDGEAGQKEYLALLSSSVRSALDGIGLPTWAKTMLDGLGNAPSLEELAKVVDTINATQSALAVMGQRLKGFAGLTEDAINELIKAAGGVDKLASAASSYYDAYYSDSEKTAVITKQVADALKAVGLQMPTTRDEYRAMVEQQLALGASGAMAAAALLKNAEAYAKFVPAVENSTTSLEAAKSALNEAYSAESDAIKSVISNTQDYVKTLTGLRDSLMIGDLSPLTPQEQYAEAARQYEATKAAALGGDATAQSGLQNAITAYLKASRTVNASSDQYKADYAKVQADLAIAIASGKSQVSTAEASLTALNKLVAGLTPANEATLSVVAAIKQLTAVLGDSGKAIAANNSTSSITSLYESLLGRAPDAGGLQFWTTQMGNGLSISAISNAMMQSPEYLSLHGSHKNGLGYVPFNGYRAELHEGEGVLTAAENLNYRAFGAGASPALVAEIRALREEVTKHRLEQAQQTGALIASNAQVTNQAADKVADAATSGAEAAAWANRTAPVIT